MTVRRTWSNENSIEFCQIALLCERATFASSTSPARTISRLALIRQVKLRDEGKLERLSVVVRES
jgi:hypothetical protein